MIKESLKIFIEKSKNLTFHPTKLYEDIRDEDFNDSLKYFLSASIPLFSELLLFLLYNWFMSYKLVREITESFKMTKSYSILSFDLSLPSLIFSLFLFLIPLIFFCIYITINIVLYSILVHIGLWIFVGKKDIKQTIKVVIYTHAFILLLMSIFFPLFLLMFFDYTSSISSYQYIMTFLSILSILIYIYSFYLLVKGVSILHKIDISKSILACLFSIPVYLLIYLIVTSSLFIRI